MTSTKKKAAAATRKRQHTPQPIREVSISFGQQELQFLVQALRDLPISGTPDHLVQALPLIQNVRLKFASALQVASGDEVPTEKDDASNEDAPPPAEKDDASNEDAPPAE